MRATYTGLINPAKKCLKVLAVLAVLMGALFATQRPAEAGTIRISCPVYATNQVDPIAFALHQHNQIGNLSTTNESTFESLYANKATSCDGKWWTNAGWYPVEGNEPSSVAAVYYRVPGDQTTIVNIPEGLQLIANKVSYNCAASPGNTQPMQSTPPYGCTRNWATHITFPSCWNGFGLEEDATVYGPTRATCPTGYHRIPEVEYTINHKNYDGVVPRPLMVSAGTSSWEDYTHMHADYFFAAQDEFTEWVDLDGDGNRFEHTPGGYSEMPLMDLCLRKAPDALEYANARCRTSGLLSWHQSAINNYYN